MIANRGEIAVRIEHTCREMGIQTVALYEAQDRSSLHVRLADECVRLESPRGFMDQDAILDIARQKGVDAIHPGYGFLAENPDFSRVCTEAGITFIGPSTTVLETLRDKPGVLDVARAAGFPTVESSSLDACGDEPKAVRTAADGLGYPLIIKSCRGGRGRAERLVKTPEQLDEGLRSAQAEAQAVYEDRHVYLEKAILPAYEVGVQILADQGGHLIHLGEHMGTLQQGSQRIIEESPAFCLSPEQRERLWQTALALGRRFNFQNVGTVEFLVDADGQFYFTEFRARIQIEHPLAELITRIDLVREQIRLVAGEALALEQQDVQLRGWAMMCRINAEDPWNHFLPSPGQLHQVRRPSGSEVRVDTYVYSRCDIPGNYDPLIAKLSVWAEDREPCVQRMRRALKDFVLIGTPTNLPLLQRIMRAPDFEPGIYSTEFLEKPLLDHQEAETDLRNLAVAAAVFYARRNQLFQPSTPDRLLSGWHRDSRRLP